MEEILELENPFKDNEVITEAKYQIVIDKLNEVIRKVNGTQPVDKVTLVLSTTEQDSAARAIRFQCTQTQTVETENIPKFKVISGNLYNSGGTLLYGENDEFEANTSLDAHYLFLGIDEPVTLEVTNFSYINSIIYNVRTEIADNPNFGTITMDGVSIKTMGCVGLVKKHKQLENLDVKYSGKFNDNIEDIALALHENQIYSGTVNPYTRLTTRANGLKINGVVVAASSTKSYWIIHTATSSTIVISTTASVDNAVATYDKTTQSWSY